MMKDSLIKLLTEINVIEDCFHTEDGISTVYGSQEFQNWRQELLFIFQSIYERWNNSFVSGIITLLENDWNGWTDQDKFAELKAKLDVVRNSIDEFFPEDAVMSLHSGISKSPKIFISHASKDKEYIEPFISLLESIGVPSECMFCSSVEGYSIPVGRNIYDYLKEQFKNFNLHIFFILSDHYYESAAALNEMGAAWILEYTYTTILLPGFKYEKIEGAVDPNVIGARLDEDREKLKNKLTQLKDSLVKEFSLSDRPSPRWDRMMENFIDKINHLAKSGVEESKSSSMGLNARCPDLIVRGTDGWHIPYKIVNFDDNLIWDEYRPLTSKDAIVYHVKITQNDLQNYNNGLPAHDQLEEYIEKRHDYLLKTTASTSISFDIANEGSCKAHDVRITMRFPDEILILDKSEIDNIPEPVKPQKPRDPIKSALLHNPCNISNSFETDLDSLLTSSQIDFSTIFASPLGDYYDNGIRIENNVLKISAGDLQHNSFYSYDQFAVVARSPGKYRVECTLLCDEFSDPVVQMIEIEVD